MIRTRIIAISSPPTFFVTSSFTFFIVLIHTFPAIAGLTMIVDSTMGLALPILATMAAWPISAAARVGLAFVIGLYCGATKCDHGDMVKLARMSNIKITMFVSSAIWAAWALARIA